MASVGLIIGATVVLKIADKRRYMLTCLIPLAYLYVTVNYAGYWMVRYVYLNPEAAGYNVLNGVLSIIMLILGLVIIIAAVKNGQMYGVIRVPDWKLQYPDKSA